MTKVSIGFSTFASLDALRQHTESLLRRSPGSVVGAELAFLRDLIKTRHPHASAFSNRLAFEVEHTSRGNAVFRVTDHGLAFPPSFRIRLARLWGESVRARVTGACRRAVLAQTAETRERWSGGPCPVTSWPLDPDTVDVDHAPPWTFARILDAWLDTLAKRANRELTGQHALNMFERKPEYLTQSWECDASVFAWDGAPEHAFAEDFQVFHNARARLRVVHPYANRIVLPALQRLELASPDE